MPTPERTVYSYYYPEVRAVIEEALNHSVFRKDLERTLRRNHKPGLDDIHDLLFAKFERHGRLNGVIGWDTFGYRYFTNGSSEGLFHLIAREKRPLYQLPGEYQGYGEYADAVGKHVETVHSIGTVHNHPPGVFLISNPSSIDGNRLPPGYLGTIIGQGHEVILDLAYLGMTDPMELSLGHDSIMAVVASMSKPFGMYYYRAGFVWTRDPVDSLYGNKWFKNVLTIKLAERVLDAVDSEFIRESFKRFQSRAVEEVERFINSGADRHTEVSPSDVWLLAHSAQTGRNRSRDFRRGDNARYCLTPYYMEYEDRYTR